MLIILPFYSESILFFCISESAPFYNMVRLDDAREYCLNMQKKPIRILI